MTARDDLKAALAKWELFPPCKDADERNAEWNLYESARRLVAELDAQPARAVLAEPSAREVLERLRAWCEERRGTARTMSDNDRRSGLVQAYSCVLDEIDRLLAALDAPQPKAPQEDDDEIPVVLPGYGNLAAKQQQAPEPSADARAWIERHRLLTNDLIAHAVQQATQPNSGINCQPPRDRLNDLAAEAVRHWTDATCTRCAAADERADRAEGRLRTATHQVQIWAAEAVAAKGERDEARKERDLARQQAHDAGERADNVKMKFERADDEIRLIATTSNYEENRILTTEILRLRAELQAVRRDRDIEHNGRDKAWMRAKKAGDALDSLRAELAEAVALLRRPMEDSTVTTADDPGCFYCDQSDGHAKDCEAQAFLAKHKETKT